MAGTEFFRMDSGRIEVVNTGQSVFIGEGTGAKDDLTFNRNIAIGTLAFIENTTGSENVAIGLGAMSSNTTGTQNVSIGNNSMDEMSAGDNNTGVGFKSLDNNDTGNNNTAIGANANVSTGNLTNATAIGANAVVSQDSSLILGDAANVGIGTSSPGHKLHVSGGDVRIDSTLRVGPAGGYGTYVTQSATNTDIGGRMATNDYFRIYATGTNDDGALVIQTGDNDTEPILFQQGTFERMRIHSNGNVGIGTNSPGYLLHVNGTAGKPGGGSWSNASDRRLKQDINSYTDGLQQLLAIRPVTYRYNEKSGHDTEPEYVGVIAQELQQVAPYMVSTFDKDEEEYLNVDPSAMIYMAINAIQEQQDIIDAQQKEIEAMKTQNQTLQTEVNEVDVLKDENLKMKAAYEKQQAEIEQIKAMMGINNEIAKNK